MNYQIGELQLVRQVIRMKFKSACNKAMEYFKKEYGDTGLCSIKDLGDKWLFDGSDDEQSIVYGKQGITIDKKTGEMELFQLPNEKNFELLDDAADISIPEEYKITA